MKLFKQVTAFSIAMLLFTSVLTGCQKKEINVSDDGTSTLASTDVANTEVAKVGDAVITVADIQYYVYNAAMMQLYQKNPQFNGDISKVDWKEKQESGKRWKRVSLMRL